MLNITKKIFYSTLAVYGTAFINQVAGYPVLEPYVECKRTGKQMIYKINIKNSLYHFGLQAIEYNCSKDPDILAVNGAYYEKSFNHH